MYLARPNDSRCWRYCESVRYYELGRFVEVAIIYMCEINSQEKKRGSDD
jgi:hypothetical protein